MLRRLSALSSALLPAVPAVAGGLGLRVLAAVDRGANASSTLVAQVTATTTATAKEKKNRPSTCMSGR